MSFIAQRGRGPLATLSLVVRSLSGTIILGFFLASASSVVTFFLHFNLAAAVSIQLLLVVVIALRGSLALATASSLAGFFCLNFLFVEPLFRFAVADSRNWISLIAFELTALFVSRLSSKAREHAAEAQQQKARSAKLYELSRAILLIDGSRSVVDQLRLLIQEIAKIDSVDIWILYDDLPSSSRARALEDPESAAKAYGSGFDEDDPNAKFSKRMLRIGTSIIGAITLKDWMVDGLVADGVASISAVAVERARAVQQQTRAASERDTETLRTVVLDGLAHGFKTPLTAIQTASSGLLALGHLNSTQTELVTIVDEQATMLNKMTTRLLQTAVLDRNEVKLRKETLHPLGLIRQLVLEQEEAIRNRVFIVALADIVPIRADGQLMEQAMLQVLNNALKYSDPGTQIKVMVTQNEHCTCVMVENAGPTIEVEDHEKIFERFYRGSAETRHSQPGTGLGLSIVRKTAAAHQGKAWVESADGLTKFFFTIRKDT